jgi:hypothetical protein
VAPLCATLRAPANSADTMKIARRGISSGFAPKE